MRCGLCGSKQISLINDSSYSYTKGIVGVAVLWQVGAVAGINGKQSMKYHCMACGQDSLDVMAGYREQEIDDAIARGDDDKLRELRMTSDCEGLINRNCVNDGFKFITGENGFIRESNRS